MLNDNMKQKYINPKIVIINIISERIICNSKSLDTCDSTCVRWHFCRDRDKGYCCFNKVEF